MCGIFSALKSDNLYELKSLFETCERNIKRRGPDSFNSISINLQSWQCLFASSVLWLQGPQIQEQPLETDKSLFLFNGDIFDGSIISYEERHKHGDTKPILEAIESSDVITVFSNVQGPYAFMYVNKRTNKYYFGRDTYGRRSLLIGKFNNTIIITSVTSKEISIPMMELPALGIFSVDFNSSDCNFLTLFPWQNQNQHFLQKIKELENFLKMSIICERDYTCNNNINITFPEEMTVEKIVNLKPEETFQFLQLDAKWSRNIESLEKLLKDAVKKRIDNQPTFCNDCIKEKHSCSHAAVGVLFSGGVDCALVALLADKFIDSEKPIDLLNVAFEHVNGYDVPDRMTARQTFEELQSLRPARQWNLVEINVSLDELRRERSTTICHLIYPLRSILDESLGCALWFAARGKSHTYTTTCRVLLVGMGADELFGGYSRHRAAFKRGKWKDLSIELDNDWKNISHRNLARDDRVVSDHGRQLRTPYLDENVVEFVRHLDTWYKCYPSDKVTPGVGDKLLLRALAYRLGLKQAALLKKRALQFGSRIANSNENAHDVSPRL